jgi:hypothetical protein
LRWDLASVTGAVYQARVRLTPLTVGMSGIEQGVAFLTNDSWSESAVTWNNQPFADRRFATWLPTVNQPVEFVVTPQVLEALAGDRQLSLQLFSIRNYGANGFVDYASREHPDVNLRPQLRLFMAGAAVTPVTRPHIVSVAISGSNLVISGTNGTPGGDYYVLAVTNVILPVSEWTRVATNVFDGNGGFQFTNHVAPGDPLRFFRLQLP